MRRFLYPLLFPAVVFLLPAAYARPEARIDISGIAGGIEFTFPPRQKCRIGYGTWLKPQYVKRYLQTTHPADERWSSGRLEFTPSRNGRIQIILMGPWLPGGRKTTVQPVGVYYDNLRLNGKALPNGGFEEGEKHLTFRNREKSLPARIISNPLLAKEGDHCALAWHEGTITFTAPVKAGEKQVLTFDCRAAGTVEPPSETDSFHPVSLARAANMGFADEIAGDGKGGWSDQGPENDLHMLKPGLQNFSGYPFRILEPEKNNGKSCIVFRAKYTPFGVKRAVLPVDRTCNEIALLNACVWGKRGTVPATVEVVTQAGEMLRFPLKIGVHTADWWNPRELAAAEVVWRAGVNAGSEVGLYLTRLDLKKPVQVRELRITSTGGDTSFLLVGATATWKRGSGAETLRFRHTVTLKEGKEFVALPFGILRQEMAEQNAESRQLLRNEKLLPRLRVTDEKKRELSFAVARFIRDFPAVLLIRNPERAKKIQLRFGEAPDSAVIRTPRAAYRHIRGSAKADYREPAAGRGVEILPAEQNLAPLRLIPDQDSFFREAVHLHDSRKEPAFHCSFEIPEGKKLKFFVLSRSPADHTNRFRFIVDGKTAVNVGGNYTMPPVFYWSGGERLEFSPGKHTLTVIGSRRANAKELALAKIFLAEELFTPRPPDLVDELRALAANGFEVYGLRGETPPEVPPLDRFTRLTSAANSYPDLSCLVDGRIDAKGKIRRSREELRFADGTALREIWGCNLGNFYVLQEMIGHRFDDESLDRFLRRVKSLGYGVLRVQIVTLPTRFMVNNHQGYLAGTSPVTYSPRLFTETQKLIAACHRNGIYLMLSLWNDNCAFESLGTTRQKNSYIGFFHPEAIRIQKEFLTRLLGTPNPERNNIPPAKDPTLLICEIENERTFVWFSNGANISDWRKLKPETREILYGLWAKFLRKKYGSFSALQKNWSVTDPASILRPGLTNAAFETVEFPPVWDVRQWGAGKTEIKIKMDDLRISESSFGEDRKSNPAVSDAMEFMYELYRDYLRTMSDHLRSLGFEGLLTACGADCEQHYVQRAAANEVLDMISGGTGYWNRGGYGFLTNLGWLSPLIYASTPEKPVISREYGGNLVHADSWWGNLIAAAIQKAMGKAYLFNFSLGFPSLRNPDWFYPQDSFDPRLGRDNYSQEAHLYSHFANLAAAIAVRSRDLRKPAFRVEIADPLENVCYAAQFRGYNKLTMGSYVPFLYADSSVRTYRGAYDGSADLVVNEPSIPGGDYSRARNLFLLKPHSGFDRYGRECRDWFRGKSFRANGFMDTPHDREAFYDAMTRAGLKLPVEREELGRVWRDARKKLELNTVGRFFKAETEEWSAFIGNSRNGNGTLRDFDLSGCGDVWSFYGKLPDSRRLFFLMLDGPVRLNAEAPSYLFLAGREIALEQRGKPLLRLCAGEKVNLGVKADSGGLATAKRLYVTFFRPKSCVMPARITFGRKVRSVTACAADGTVLRNVPVVDGGFSNLWENGSRISYYKVIF